MYLVRETQFYIRFHSVYRQNIITLCTRTHVHRSPASMHGYCLECARGVGGIAVCVAVRRGGAASLFHFVWAALPVACHVRFRGDSRVEVNDKGQDEECKEKGDDPFEDGGDIVVAGKVGCDKGNGQADFDQHHGELGPERGAEVAMFPVLYKGAKQKRTGLAKNWHRGRRIR